MYVRANQPAWLLACGSSTPGSGKVPIYENLRDSKSSKYIVPRVPVSTPCAPKRISVNARVSLSMKVMDCFWISSSQRVNDPQLGASAKDSIVLARYFLKTP